MCIVRLHLTRHPNPAGLVEEKVGQGTLVRIPLAIAPESQTLPPQPEDEQSLRSRLKQGVRNHGLYNPVIWRLFGAKWLAKYRLHPQPGQAIGAGAATAELLRTVRVDLVMMHFFGGADADEVILETRKAGVPFAVLNHYSNDRFLHFAIRKHTALANRIAGVNGLDLPRYVRGRLTNLSDGIDTDFFRRSLARPLMPTPRKPIILLPARVVREKGQLDLVRAIAALRKTGVECCIALAGRVESSSFVQELRQVIDQLGLTEYVLFLGELNVEELRDWYAASAVVAFPTYHHEGLGRVIVEAQAMEVPVVAYATGGVPEGVVQEQTGYLIPTGNLEGLIGRLEYLLRNPELRQTMGKAGREFVARRYSLEALAERHENFYLQVMNRARSRVAIAPH